MWSARQRSAPVPGRSKPDLFLAFACYRCALLLLLFFFQVGSNLATAAPPDEQHAFESAVKNLNAGFYEPAEKDFREFVQTYTNSPRLPEAILLQAQAQAKQTNYSAAIDLLAARLNIAGTNSDQYLFWLAEAHFQKGEFGLAADSFAKMINDFPGSPRRLEAAIREATARAQLVQWPAVLTLLRQTNGAFQSAARTNAGDKFVVQGYLLLSEAELAQQDPAAAERALQPISKLLLPPLPTWQWNYLLARIKLAQGKAEEALVSTTNMLAQSTEAGLAGLRADTIAFQAGILERLGRMAEATATYSNNLAAAVPAERQRQALLKITELSLARNELTNAAQMLNQFLSQHPAAAAADLAWLTLGELQLRQYVTTTGADRGGGATNVSVVTNLLSQAQASFEALAKAFPQSAYYGKGQLDLGWCFWLQNKVPESEKAFATAVQRLPASPDQAIAFFKLADSQFQQKNFTNALANYNAVIEKFGSLPEVKTNLFEPALYQSTRAALASGQTSAATNSVAKLLAWYPKGFHTERAALLAGQHISQQGTPMDARKIFSDLLAAAPGADLLPQVQLAIARTYEEEEKWPQAIAEYDSWLTAYTNNGARPAALYYQARANFFDHRETNALTLFTNFVAQFPTNEFTPLAQWWVADYYYQHGDFPRAENQFQQLFQNWPASELAYQARLMAGRAAVASVVWTDAMLHFTNLISDLQHCPPDVRLQAMFAYGDTLMTKDSTNKVADYEEAISVFNAICQMPATNRQIDLAWGELAICYLQWAQAPGKYQSLTNALNAFQKVLDSPHADATARSIAMVGMGVVLEVQAQQKTVADEQAALLKLALDNYLRVFNGGHLLKDQMPDPFWTKKAGLEAGRLAEKLQWWAQAIAVYRNLEEMLPALSASLENRIRKAQEHLKTAKVD